MDVDRDAKKHIMELVERLHEFGHWIEAYEMELWNQMLDMAPKV